ncbi:hypothetical protein CL634_02735 [bacterium]|nr:hypothetical protein [bacterium]|tara:strand:+ start:1015 stop:1602 length:588 start_codon:yes stop_codon:yes gene_type:complete
MKKDEASLIWEAYENQRFAMESEDSEKDELAAELKELQQQMMYYQAADDPNRWREETGKREALQRKISELQNKLSPPAPAEPRPTFIRDGIFPTLGGKRMSMRDLQAAKKELFSDGRYDVSQVPEEWRKENEEDWRGGDPSGILPRHQRFIASYWLKFGVLPTEVELMATDIQEGPIPFKPSEHPELEGKVWEIK